MRIVRELVFLNLKKMSSEGAQRYREEKKLKKEKEGYELLRIKKQIPDDGELC